jgi:6-phosphogluconolactonase/glucosamine-6-phosphate isomerase/deaminase
MALEDDLRDSRARIAAAQAKKTRAEAEHDSAVERLTLAKKTLKDEHGVSTVAEGKKKLAELKTALDDALADADAKLKEAGA